MNLCNHCRMILALHILMLFCIDLVPIIKWLTEQKMKTCSSLASPVPDTVQISNLELSRFQMVKKRLVCRWSGFWMSYKSISPIVQGWQGGLEQLRSSIEWLKTLMQFKVFIWHTQFEWFMQDNKYEHIFKKYEIRHCIRTYEYA